MKSLELFTSLPSHIETDDDVELVVAVMRNAADDAVAHEREMKAAIREIEEQHSHIITSLRNAITTCFATHYEALVRYAQSALSVSARKRTFLTSGKFVQRTIPGAWVPVDEHTPGVLADWVKTVDGQKALHTAGMTAEDLLQTKVSVSKRGLQRLVKAVGHGCIPSIKRLDDREKLSLELGEFSISTDDIVNAAMEE